jgi:hypothetical protein
MLARTTTSVAVHGPLGGAHNTLSVFATASGPQLRDTAEVTPGVASMAAHTVAARRDQEWWEGRMGRRD